MNITPFGRTTKYKVEDPVPIDFVLYNTEQAVQNEDSNAGIYRPAASIHNIPATRISSDFSVRITNVPTRVTQGELLEIILKKIQEDKNTKQGELINNLFTRLNLVVDRETRASRGYAYANCENSEKARELSRIVRMIVIDACVLGAEIVE